MFEEKTGNLYNIILAIEKIKIFSLKQG